MNILEKVLRLIIIQIKIIQYVHFSLKVQRQVAEQGSKKLAE
jgi:hypothetical protein